MEHDLDDLPLAHQVRVLDQVAVDVYLLERLGMHEIAAQIVLVEILVGTALDADRLDPLAGRKGLVQNTAVLEVLQFGADESRTLAGLHVQELDDRKRLAVQLDAHPVLDISCGCHCIR